MNQTPHISVIISVYGCAGCLEDLYDRLVQSIEPISKDFEIILINDCSPDNSWERIRFLAEKDDRIKGINFSKNFGQHYAISAGFDYAKGDWIVCMDCDLQDLPEEIPNLYNKAKEGYDIVYGISEFRSKKGVLNKLVRLLYFKFLDLLAQNPYKTTNLSFFILSKNVRDNIIRFREHSRHISSIIRDQGFNIIGINVNHDDRKNGKSSYTLIKRIELAYIGLLVYSTILLKIAFVLGFLFSTASILGALYIVINKFLNHFPLPGWASLMTVVLLSTGLILMFLGIIGMYIEKIFLEVKKRPLYIVKEELNVALDEERIN